MAEVPHDAGEQPQIKSIFPLSQQEMQTPQKVTKSLFDQSVWIIVVVVCIILLLLSVNFYQQKTTQQYSAALQNRPTITPTQRPYPTQPPPKHWVLKKSTESGIQSVLSVCGEEFCYSSEISQWGDWIFYKSNEGENIQIKSYNVKTEQTSTLYDVVQSASDFGGTDRHLPSELSDMQIIGDTLYFSLGGYLTQGGLFWLSLPPQSKPQKMLVSRNARILYWKGRYWIIAGEGDACWNETDYSLLNTQTNQVKKVATSTVGCYEGEEFIEIDKKDRMLLAFHSRASTEEVPKDSMSDMYRYVIAISLSDPSIKEGVIAKQNMPANISQIYYLPDSNQLALVGPKKYVYDFTTQTIQHVDLLPEKPPEYNLHANKKVAEIIHNFSLPPGYTFVLE